MENLQAGGISVQITMEIQHRIKYFAKIKRKFSFFLINSTEILIMPNEYKNC